MPKPNQRPTLRQWVPREGHFGELSTNSNWPDKTAKIIRECRMEGFTYHDLKKIFGGSEEAISDLCNGRTYPTAGGPIAGVDYPGGKHGKSLL